MKKLFISSFVAVSSSLAFNASAGMVESAKDVAIGTGNVILATATTPVEIASNLVGIVVGKNKPSDVVKTAAGFTGAIGEVAVSATELVTAPVDMVCDGIESKTGLAGKVVTLPLRAPVNSAKVLVAVSNDVLHVRAPDVKNHIPAKKIGTVTVEKVAPKTACCCTASSKAVIEKAPAKRNATKKRTPWSR